MTKISERNDFRQLKNTDYLINNLCVGLRKTSSKPGIKKESELDGIEAYLYIPFTEGKHIIITEELLKPADLTPDEAWNIAEVNTAKKAVLVNLNSILAELSDGEYEETAMNETPLYVLTNKNKMCGASAILNKNILREFGHKHNTDKIVVFPASIHEMLIMPYKEDYDMNAMSMLVKTINETQVEPHERLTDKAYLMAV